MESTNRVMLVGGVIAIVALVGLLFYAKRAENVPSVYTAFAECLKDKGAVFYGAFWCPHCQSQKAMFGSAKKYLPYVECSTPNGQGQLQICKEKEIKGYPTWVFADGSRENGEMKLARLAEKTGCVLPN